MKFSYKEKNDKFYELESVIFNGNNYYKDIRSSPNIEERTKVNKVSVTNKHRYGNCSIQKINEFYFVSKLLSKYFRIRKVVKFNYY